MYTSTPTRRPAESSPLTIDGRIAIIVSRYHSDITQALLAGAREELLGAGISKDVMDVWNVPGAFELAQAASFVASSRRYAAIIPLGCLVRGETSHFDYIARTVSSGLDAVARTHGIPVAFGLLTVDDLAQARARAGGDLGNKGAEAARAALEMIVMKKELHVE